MAIIALALRNNADTALLCNLITNGISFSFNKGWFLRKPRYCVGGGERAMLQDSFRVLPLEFIMRISHRKKIPEADFSSVSP